MKFAGLNINMPEEVQEAINKRGAISYIQYLSGKAIEGIGMGAVQGGGEGSGFAMMGAGMVAGVGMGNMMAQGMAARSARAVRRPEAGCGGRSRRIGAVS